MSGKDLIAEHIELIILFGTIAFAANWIALKKDFYRLQASSKLGDKSLSIMQVIWVFAIYLGTLMALVPILSKIIYAVSKHSNPLKTGISFATVGWLQFTGIILAMCFLYLFCRRQDPIKMKKIWKDDTYPDSRSIAFDFGFGLMTWLISFPVIAVIGQITDLIVYLIFGVVTYEQVAVRYLKMALGSPAMLVVALFVILLAAPVIEEFLFRGFLQTWFKQHVGQKAAILLAALCFACFHLAPSQGVGNISLAASLFVFACFLGFIYERQGSLFAPIGLHMAFNAVSAFRILFVVES
ncbi:MAG TPA: CPBP family intramembrane glutamic endopeptidase [Rhabdochlamydiaceae bacterium]|nr:CPBP family intramembrane glutamic endopeptidase [Rhabdochlamydiaceae bacterium]